MTYEPRPAADLTDTSDAGQPGRLVFERGHIAGAGHVPTEVRFSVRSLLVAMAAVAVVAAACGTFLRLLPVEAQARVVAFWGVLIVVTLLLIGRGARQRVRAERHAGQVLLQLVPHSYFFPRASRIDALVGAVTLFGVAAVMVVLMSIMAARAWAWDVAWEFGLGLVLNSCLIGIMAASGAANVWWNQRIRVGQRGIVVGSEFLAWDKLRRHYWDACHRGVIVLEWVPQRTIAAKVPKEDRLALETLLAERSRGYE